MLSARRRFAVPAVLAGLIALGSAVPGVQASASPELPRLTPAALLTKMLGARVSAFSGTVAWTADLGLPSIGALTSGAGQGVPSSSGFAPSSLLSGTQRFRVWADGSSRQRVASLRTLGESDLLHVGDQIWAWDSSTGKVTHDIYTPGRGTGAGSAAPGWADPASLAPAIVAGLQRHQTSLSVSRPVRVAGVAAYELRVAPSGAAATGSKVSSVVIAVDARNGLPLQVSIRASGQTGPALSVGFTTISFATPPASRFAPPTGRSTVTHRIGGGLPTSSMATGLPAGLRTVGSGWDVVALGSLPAGPTATLLDRLGRPVSGQWGSGRLISTSLVDVLLTPGGRLLVGAVQPSVLEAAASAAG